MDEIPDIVGELKRLGEQLEQSEWDTLKLKVRPLAEALSAFSSDGVLFVSRRGRILYANQKLSEMFGYTIDELTKHPVEMLIPEDVRDRHPQHRADFMAMAKSRPMGAGIALGLRGRKKNGTEFKVGISLNPGKIDSEPIVFLVCTALE
jgi:PAS domain S-box-containing protein